MSRILDVNNYLFISPKKIGISVNESKDFSEIYKILNLGLIDSNSQTCFSNINKVPSGSYLEYSKQGIKLKSYYKIEDKPAVLRHIDKISKLPSDKWLENLKKLGYNYFSIHKKSSYDKKIIKSFQMHYLPNNVTGKIDEKTFKISHFLTI